ncbi:MAG: sodium/proline symporter [Lentisphaeraceae bacterium]|nr:sodium/proline symporter [Lentisphaeraceae bacterium]
MALFAIIGCSAITKSKKNSQDYLVAGRSLPPWLAGLSAVATNNSGFMFIGMIGYTYNSGLITIWFMIGWLIGDYIGLKTVLAPIVTASHKDDSRSLSSLLAHWLGHEKFKYFAYIASLITVIFLTVYAAAQFKAGSKSLDVIFGLDKSITIGVSAGLVLLYCFSGGIRASIWTDVAQSFVMIIGMFLLMTIGMANIPEIKNANIPEGFFSLYPGFQALALTVLGAIGGGVMITGQPHIVSRFFTLRSADDSRILRRYYYLWFASFYMITIAVGILCRLILDTNETFDPEMALPQMAMKLLPDAGVGLILAAIFAATISTADSLILACTAAIDEELNHQKSNSLVITKVITLTVLLASVGIALLNNDTIFNLVLDAWAMLGVSFTPLILSRCAGYKFSEKSAISLSLAGLLLFLFISKGQALVSISFISDLFQTLNSYYLTPFVTLAIVSAIGVKFGTKTN